MNSFQIATKINTKIINDIIDDAIQIKHNSLNKEAFRNTLIQQRLTRMNNSSLLTVSDINSLSQNISSCESEYKLAVALKKIYRVLKDYHKELITIFNRLR